MLKKMALISALCCITVCTGLITACNNNNGNNNNSDTLIYTYNEQDGYYLVKAKNTDISGSIEIPSEYKGKKVNISASAFLNCQNLESVSIGENVEIIGENAFQRCLKLNGILGMSYFG